MKNTRPDNIETYIAAFPAEVRVLLEQMRATVHLAAPEAEEAIRYGMPTFILHGNLVHFAAFTNHIGFYPAPMGIAAFKKELSVYKGGKGSIQFPIGEPLPLGLVSKIVQYRVQKNLEKLKKKAIAKKARPGKAAPKKAMPSKK